MGAVFFAARIPLMLCVFSLRPTGCVSLLSSPQSTGVTALMEAAKGGSVPLVRAILQRGGNPNALDNMRLSVVHYAAIGGVFEVCQFATC